MPGRTCYARVIGKASEKPPNSRGREPGGPCLNGHFCQGFSITLVSVTTEAGVSITVTAGLVSMT